MPGAPFRSYRMRSLFHVPAFCKSRRNRPGIQIFNVVPPGELLDVSNSPKSLMSYAFHQTDKNSFFLPQEYNEILKGFQKPSEVAVYYLDEVGWSREVSTNPPDVTLLAPV